MSRLRKHIDPKDVLHILRGHIGRARAIQAGEIARLLGLRGRYADRPVRKAIRDLRRDGHLVLSTTHQPPGYFLAASVAEWREHGQPMRSRALDLLKTVSEMDKAASAQFGTPEELRPTVQLDLELR